LELSGGEIRGTVLLFDTVTVFAVERQQQFAAVGELGFSFHLPAKLLGGGASLDPFPVLVILAIVAAGMEHNMVSVLPRFNELQNQINVNKR